jgi:hypothetical protein
VTSNTRGPGGSCLARIPIRFRSIEVDRDDEYSTETVSIAKMWFLMKSPHPLEARSMVALRVQIPIGGLASPSCELRVNGCVLSEHHLRDGSYKVTIEADAGLLRGAKANRRRLR